MFCERLLNIYRRHPSFTPVSQIVELLRQEISLWPTSGENRPDMPCLEEAWEFGAKKVHEQVASPRNVAECLLPPILDGQINPFAGLRPEVVDSHMLTASAGVSFALRECLRRPMELLRPAAGQGPCTLVRAVVLGFRWDEPFPGREGQSIETLVRSASSADLLLAYRFASAIVADRVSSAETQSELRQSVIDLRVIMDGIVARLAKDGGGDSEARRIVRVIQLERVIQAMVDLLTKSGPELERAMPGIMAELGVGEDGPVAHLREYVARGNPLNELVGHEQQADVRRDLERIMEPVSDVHLPGFPARKVTSRRASELLRRLRFLVRSILLKASEPNAPEVFRAFRASLFRGADRDCQLAVARVAFERPAGGGPTTGTRAIRAQLQNLAVGFGFEGCSADAACEHAFVRALRGAMKIELDTWSQARDGDSVAFLDAVLDVLRAAEASSPDLEPDQLVQSVIHDDAELMAAMKRGASDPSRPPERSRLFKELTSGTGADSRSSALHDAVEEGLDAFKRLIRANHFREFNRSALQDILNNELFDDESEYENAEICRKWLESWAFLERASDSAAFADASSRLGSAATAAELEADALGNPFRVDGYSGGSLLYRLADAAAQGHLAAKAALDAILMGASARQAVEAAGFDKVGRSIGLVLAQGVSRTALDHLFGAGRGFDVHFTPSVDGVTATMSAVRFGDGTIDDVEQRQRMKLVLKYDVHHHGKDPRDARGWRAIHHAFAAGNLAGVRVLVEHDPACMRHQPGDQTTFLIEAIRCATTGRDPSEVFLAAIDMLSKLDRGHQVEILKFKGCNGMDGMPLSIVSAALSKQGGRWPMLEGLLLQNPDYREAILSGVSKAELEILLRDPDDSRFAGFCQQYSQIPQGRQRLAEALSSIEPSAASLVLGMVASGKSALSARAKCRVLREHGALDLGKVDPSTRDNALHRLAKAAGELSTRGGTDAFAGELHALVWNMLQIDASTERCAELVSAINLDGETPIALASRLGVPSLAIAYSQFLGILPVTSDERWLEAARVIKDPDRYQDGIPQNRRLAVNAENLLVLGAGDAPAKVLSKRPLPSDRNARAARAWLIDNAMEIARSLQEHFQLNADVPLSAFVLWLAHLSSERATSPSASR
jgi:hypothetical protein